MRPNRHWADVQTTTAVIDAVLTLLLLAAAVVNCVLFLAM